METLIAPITTLKLLELFKNPELVFTIDYGKSLLKGEVFTEYIGNSKINCYLTGLEDVSYEEKSELLNTWIDTRITSEILTLKEVLSQILLDLPNNYFTAEETERFKIENKEILDEIRQFFFSMIIMIPSISVEFKDHILSVDVENGIIKEVDGTDRITPNIYNLVFYPNFIDLFLGRSEEDFPLTYYKGVIESYYYKDKSFFELLTSEGTAPNLIAIFNYFFNENTNQEQA